jgi:hypothetical protein
MKDLAPTVKHPHVGLQLEAVSSQIMQPQGSTSDIKITMCASHE